MFTLRDYQLETNRSLWRAFRDYDSVLLQAPTGSGKTLMASHLIAMRREHKGESVLMLAHRREIVNQTAAKLMDANIETGIIMASHAPMIWANVQVGSIDTLWSRKHYGFPPAQFLIIDECHRAAGDRYQKVIEHYRAKGAKILGLTATPMRTDGRGLKPTFQMMVRTPDIPQLQADGWLVKVRYRVGLVPDISKVKVLAGEYNQKEREEAHDKGILIGDIVENWLRYASDRRTMVFASGVRHSIHIVDQFKAAGINAAHVDGETPKEERDHVYDQITNGNLQVVSNAMVYVEGTDIPCIDCIVDAGATKSLVKYLQAGGRGMRPYPGKQDLLYMDHAGNVMRHGLLETPRDWFLSEGKEQVDKLAEQRKNTERLQLPCKQCGFLHNCVICPQCGYTFKPEGEAAAFLPGMLVEMTIADFEAAKNAKRKKPAKVEKTEQEWYSEFLGMAEERGKTRGWGAHRFFLKTGHWPKGLTETPVLPSRQALDFDRHARIKYAKSKAKEKEAANAASLHQEHSGGNDLGPNVQ